MEGQATIEYYTQVGLADGLGKMVAEPIVMNLIMCTTVTTGGAQAERRTDGRTQHLT
jgi:hypothetical protein